MTDVRVPIDDLLAHRAWVRAVARAIARRDADADDLEQDAWVAAVEGPPRHDASLRGWFRGVLRRRAAMRVRGDVRRDGRERATARPEDGSRPADDLVAEAESHARVAQAVVALAEPFRTAILLRFFEGLPPREVAARTDVPVETARSRIKRGLALLRASLGDDDERAALVLAPLLAAPRLRVGPASTTTAAAAAAGGLAMGLGTKLVAAAAVLVGAAAAWWTVRDVRAPDVATAPRVESAQNVAATTRGTPRVRARDVVPSLNDEATPTAVAPTSARRVVRWRVVAGEVPIPADGTTLAVEQRPGSVSLPSGARTVRVEGGELVSEGLGRGTIQGFAVASDGARAQLFAKDGDERGLDTSFQRERKIVVTLVEPDGRPAVGVPLQLRNGGNNTIRSGAGTDAGGRSTFAGLSPKEGRLVVHLVQGSAVTTRSLGTVDIGPGDVDVTWTLPAARDVTLRVTVDGERRIPPKCSIWPSEASVDDRHDDDARGDIRLRMRPSRDGAEIRASISADGRASTVFTVPAGHDPATVDVAIPRGVTFVGRILPPGDLIVRVNPTQPPRCGPSVVFERRYDREGNWNRVFTPGTPTQEGTAPGADGMIRFTPLPLGKYRLRDAATGATSAEVELVEDGAESAVCTLDLSRSGPVRGRLELDLWGINDARVVVEGVPDPVTGDVKRRTVQPTADGKFETWIPGDRTVRLRAEHPLWRPDPKLGAVEVTRPTDDVALRLVLGPLLSFKTPGGRASAEFRRERVLFFRGEPTGEPAFTRTAVFNEGEFLVGGFDVGTWTLWIDVPERAPKVLRDVVLGDGKTDLGNLDLERGLSLRVRIATFPNEVAPRIGITVSRKDGVPFHRFAHSNRESEVVVAGLVPGTYEVFCYPQTGSFRSDFMQSNDPPYLRKTVVVDAAGETVIDYSPR